MSNSSALIGYTGFVGSNILQAMPFDALFNSKNISEIEGSHFELVVCAGVSATKWLANKEPESDWAQIELLMRHLKKIKASYFVLVSTIDVYQPAIGCTEDHRANSIEPYGMHRRLLEDWVASEFSNHLIVRLPALFGRGLKKNAIFDLMNSHRTEYINPESIFQFYPLDRIGRDLGRLMNANLPLVNLAPEPLAMSTIVDAFFRGASVGKMGTPKAVYDMRTLHPALLGEQNDGGHHLSQATIISALGDFLRRAEA